MRRLSVCLSVCPSRSWIVSKRIKISSKFFSPSGSHTILVLPYHTEWRYFNGNPPNGDVKCRWGRQKSRFWAYMPAVDAATGEVLSTWTPVEHGHHLASCDTYIAGRILWVFDHQAPRAITSHRRRGSTARDRPSRSRTIHNHDGSCVWQQGLTLRRRQHNRIELYALVNPKLK